MSSLASQLDRGQRKALRRLGRGQTINRSMMNDPLVREFFTTEHFEQPPNIDDVPYPESMFIWMEWEERARGQRPKLSPLGAKTLEELERLQ